MTIFPYDSHRQVMAFVVVGAVKKAIYRSNMTWMMHLNFRHFRFRGKQPELNHSLLLFLCLCVCVPNSLTNHTQMRMRMQINDLMVVKVNTIEIVSGETCSYRMCV